MIIDQRNGRGKTKKQDARAPVHVHAHNALDNAPNARPSVNTSAAVHKAPPVHNKVSVSHEWQYVDDNNKWMEFDSFLSSTIERALSTGELSVLYTLPHSEYTYYEIIFADSKQYNTSTGAVRDVRQISVNQKNNRRSARWQCNVDGTWTDYKNHDSQLLENAYVNGDYKIKLNMFNSTYEVIFSEMSQLNLSSQVGRDIRRVRYNKQQSSNKKRKYHKRANVHNASSPVSNVSTTSPISNANVARAPVTTVNTTVWNKNNNNKRQKRQVFGSKYPNNNNNNSVWKNQPYPAAKPQPMPVARNSWKKNNAHIWQWEDTDHALWKEYDSYISKQLEIIYVSEGNCGQTSFTTDFGSQTYDIRPFEEVQINCATQWPRNIRRVPAHATPSVITYICTIIYH